MSFPVANLRAGLQPHLADYMNDSNYFSRNYYGQQTPTYPFFHPAAMAAIAAAATGYSQFGGNMNAGPLNLSSVPGYRGMYPFGVCAMGNTTVNQNSSFTLEPNSYLSNLASSASTSVNSTGSSSVLNQSTPMVGNARATGSTDSETCSSFHADSRITPRSTKSCITKLPTKTRLKKSVNAEEVANRKRQEFDVLAQVRTEKLLSDGPVYSTATTSAERQLSSANSLSTGLSYRETSSGPNYKKLMEAVLDAKKSALLRSPSVVQYLELHQRSLVEYKRRTGLFAGGGIHN